MPWPGPNEYSQAVLTPKTSFGDPDLMAGLVDYHKAGGIPQTITGNFACIYRVKGSDRSWAIKCFLRNISDQAQRYDEIQKHLARFCMENTIGFKYLTQGIRVEGEWYPIVKMDWVDGDPLDWYIQKNSRELGTVNDLVQQFKQMCQRLYSSGLAHGDLHHGNIYVTKKGLRLLDYDGAYVPALSGFKSNELGHPNYQHPGRSQSHFGPYLDNFSAWVIYTSLFCLNIDGSLWQRLAGGDECLLFRSSDFGNPLASYTFSLLENHSSIEIRQAAKRLREFCDMTPDMVPRLGDTGKSDPNLAPLKSSTIVPNWAPSNESAREDAQEREPGGYPGFREYNEAMRFPEVNLDDAELKRSACILEDTKVGRNGRVYHFRGPTRDLAVKVFYREDPAREQRYRALARAASRPGIREFLVDFEYLVNGVNVDGKWYPILKMEWVKGMLIHEVPPVMISDGIAGYLADQFATLIRSFKAAGIAHGDLEFSNMFMVDNDLKVVDYDTIFVPELSRAGSPELGHPGFQHPKRTTKDYAPYVDNFSAWLIHFLLRNLSLNHKLHELAEVCLQEERRSAEHVSLRGLEHHPDGVTRKLGNLLRLLLARPLHMIPDLHPEETLESIISKASREVSQGGGLLKRRPMR